MNSAPFKMNHRLTFIVITDLKAPYIGPGRWQMKPLTINNHVFQEAAYSGA